MRKLDFSLPHEIERIIGFTIPSVGAFYICDHDNVWRVAVGATFCVDVTDHPPYEFIESRTDFLGLVFNGLRANDPIFCIGQNEFSYDFDPKNDFVTLNYKISDRNGKIEFRTFSGDWFAASFSDDGKYLVLAEPYDIALYEIY